MGINDYIKLGIKNTGQNVTVFGDVYPAHNISSNLIDIEHIAHGLSNLCRYGGQCPRFYSIAEHCVVMSEWDTNRSNAEKLQFLLHDAASAYMGECCPDYQQYKRILQAKIAAKFHCLPGYGGDSIIQAHKGLLYRYEIRELWSGGSRLKCWTPKEACTEFMMRFNDLS